MQNTNNSNNNKNTVILTQIAAVSIGSVFILARSLAAKLFLLFGLIVMD